MRKGNVFVNGRFAGVISEGDEGFVFAYDPSYLASKGATDVSLTLPLREEPYQSKTMFPFFDGLIPEGWLLDVAVSNWKVDERDRMGLLLCACRDPIGDVSVEDDSDA